MSVRKVSVAEVDKYLMPSSWLPEKLQKYGKYADELYRTSAKGFTKKAEIDVWKKQGPSYRGAGFFFPAVGGTSEMGYRAPVRKLSASRAFRHVVRSGIRKRRLISNKFRTRLGRNYRATKKVRLINNPGYKRVHGAVVPAFSQQSVVRGMRRPRPLVGMPQIDRSLAPMVWEDDFNGIFNFASNSQAVATFGVGASSSLFSALTAFSSINAHNELGQWTSYFARVLCKNQTNVPIHATLYYFKCIRNTDKTFYQLWENGVQDYTGTSTITPQRKFSRPQTSALLLRYYKITAAKKYMIAGGDQVSFNLKKKRPKIVGKSWVDAVDNAEYQAGYYFGACLVVHGTIVDDGTTVGLSSGKLAVMKDAHYTFRALLNNNTAFANVSAPATLSAQNVMNVESDTVTTLQTA